jgi:hypothetical protein
MPEAARDRQRGRHRPDEPPRRPLQAVSSRHESAKKARSVKNGQPFAKFPQRRCRGSRAFAGPVANPARAAPAAEAALEAPGGPVATRPPRRRPGGRRRPRVRWRGRERPGRIVPMASTDFEHPRHRRIARMASTDFMHTLRMYALPPLATSLQCRSAGMASSHFVATKIPGPARGRLGFLVPQKHCLPYRLSDIASAPLPRRLPPRRAGGPAVGSAAVPATAGACHLGREEARRCWVKGAAPQARPAKGIAVGTPLPWAHDRGRAHP